MRSRPEMTKVRRRRTKHGTATEVELVAALQPRRGPILADGDDGIEEDRARHDRLLLLPGRSILHLDGLRPGSIPSVLPSTNQFLAGSHQIPGD